MQLEYLLALHIDGFLWTEKNQYLYKETNYNLEKLCNILIPNDLNTKLENAKNLIVKHTAQNINLISYFDDRYPTLLKNIYDPPLILFCLGNLNLLSKKTVSMVGTRNPSQLSIRWSNFIANYYSTINTSVVSGMAEGIDSACHRAAYNNIGGTIGVVAHGLDHVYPKSNYDLFKLAKYNTQNNVLLISEYPLGVKPQRYFFPKRNRIISGLSESLLFIEGSIKSGAIISCKYALEQGRHIFALNHPLIKNNSGGIQLLKDGASNLSDYFNVVLEENKNYHFNTLSFNKDCFYLGNYIWAKFSINY